MKKQRIIFLKILTFFILWISVISIIFAIGDPTIIKGHQYLIRLWWELIPFLAVILLTIFFYKIVEENKLKKDIQGNVLKKEVFSIIVGILWIGIPILLLHLTGNLQWGKINYVPYLFVWVLSILINVIMQEFLVRGYIFDLIKKEYNKVYAIIINTIIFTLFHGGAFEAGGIAILNVITMSIFVSLLLIYTKNLLGPIIVHSIWNIVGSLLGLITLADDYPILIDCVINGNEIITGGIYKLEGSIIVLFINLISIILMYLLINNRGKGLKINGNSIL